MDRLSDRGSIPLRSIIKLTLEILDFRGFLLSGGEKKCRFEPFQTGSEWKNWGQNWGQNRSENHLKNLWF